MRSLLLALIPLVASTPTCKKPADSPAQGMPAGPVPVQVSHPLPSTFQPLKTFTGRIEAVESVALRAQVSGYLASVDFEAGSLVEAGQILFTIDPRPYQAAVAQAEANVKSAEASLQAAEREATRAEQLVSSNAIAQQESDQRASELLAAQAQQLAARAALDTARLNLEFTEVKAPIAGRISRESITAGNLIQAGSMAQPLAQLTSTEAVFVTFDIPESLILTLPDLAGDTGAARPTAQVSFDSAPGRTFPARIDYIAPEVDRATGTLRVRGVIEGDEAKALVPGMFCRVSLPQGPPQPVQLIAEQAILADQGQSMVWVVDDHSQVAFRPIRKGEIVDGLRAVTSGLAPEDRVIVAGVMRLSPGMPVQPQDIEMPRLTVPGAPTQPGAEGTPTEESREGER